MLTRRDLGKIALGSLPLVRCASMFGSALDTGQAASKEGEQVAAGKRAARSHVDREWVKKAMVNDLLDHWLQASVMPNGFIQENLDRQWKPMGTQREASLNGQGRQLYCMVAGYEYSGDKRYLTAITKCADFLLKMRDPEFGGFYNRTTPDLKVIDDTKTGYTSFTIFPLAHAARVTKNQKYADAAMKSWTEVRDKMRDGQFFYNSMKRDFSGPAPVSNIGNPSGARNASGGPTAGAMAGRRHGLNVHMFEALLALYDTTESKEVWAEIMTEMAAMEKMYDYKLGYLPEGYDENWHAPTPQSFNVGHLFEWGSLFSRAVELGADKKFVELGSRSVDLGLKVGFHKPTGGTWMIAKPDSTPARDYMIWWTQCETLKATARYAIRHGRDDLWPYFDQALAFVKQNFLDNEYGGWFEGVIPGSPREALGERAYIKGAVDGPELGSYHQTTMFTDLLHLTEA
jgi:mannose/cellobiose epimerase-like protein (N-acyl-D-glucosamine 2-epimerase family)